MLNKRLYLLQVEGILTCYGGALLIFPATYLLAPGQHEFGKTGQGHSVEYLFLQPLNSFSNLQHVLLLMWPDESPVERSNNMCGTISREHHQGFPAASHHVNSCNTSWVLLGILLMPLTIPEAENPEDRDRSLPSQEACCEGQWGDCECHQIKLFYGSLKAVRHSGIVSFACWHDNLKNLHFWTCGLIGFHSNFRQEKLEQGRSKCAAWLESG